MGWHYISIVNLISGIGLFTLHLTYSNTPWYLTAILCLNIMLLGISALTNDEKDKERDKRIEQLEKELRELKKKESKND